MTKLRTIAIAGAIAAAVAAPQARATDGSAGGEWDSQYGMIFSVQNVFGNNNASVIGEFGGGVGLQYVLAPQRALRFSIDLSRASNPGYETESTSFSSTTSTTTKGYQRPTGFTSRYMLDVGADYLMRLSPAKVSPYLGVGGSLGYTQSALKFEDGINNPSELYAKDDLSRTFGLAAVGTLGLEWRMHRSVSLFAEYGLNLNLMTYESSKFETTTLSRTTGQTVGSKSEGSRTKFFNFDAGIAQGGQLGLVAFF